MGFLEERDLTGVPTIPEFYKGKTIFITGGSGYMGKVLIEKLLYSCTDLERIYLLLRAKKGVTPKERLEKMYNLPCFDRLRRDRPGVYESKVTVLNGDATKTGFDLSPEDRDLMINKVNIIFHVAASVRFDDSLPDSININLRSTIELMEIAKEMKNLNAFVHVSTAYANSQWDPVEERMYPPYANWKDTIQICDNLDDKTLQILTPKYIGGLPNTYIFTKQLAEQAVYEQRGKLPIVITRPSIVVASLNEPMRGWVENFNGPIGLIVGVGKGVLRCLYSGKDFSADFVPVDECIKHFIAAAWIRGTKPLNPSDDIEIYNCCSRERIDNEELMKIGAEITQEEPLEDPIWTPNCIFTSSQTYFYLNVLLQHLLPALLIDMILWLSGNKPKLLKIQKKIFISTLAIQKFLNTEWIFEIDNLNELRTRIKEQDRQDFGYNFKNFFSKQYFLDCTRFGRKYLLKEKDYNVSRAKAQLKRLNIADKILSCATYVFIAWLFFNSNFVSNIRNSMF